VAMATLGFTQHTSGDLPWKTTTKKGKHTKSNTMNNFSPKKKEKEKI
jgi:hypothetical protein